MLVLDTSALLFWTLDPSRLTPAARAAIDGANRKLISSISLWEVGLKAAKGALQLPMSVQTFADRVHALRGVEVLAVDWQTWRTNLELPWTHRDPADRTIVATALLRGCPLVTSDAEIRAFYSGAVW